MSRLVLMLFICSFASITSYIKDCDENCFFYDIDINRESIKNWPTTCEKVCGNITISSYNTDLTEEELTPVFKNLTKLVGNLKIEYTNFKSLEFLNSNLQFWFDYFNRTGTIVIRANPMLTNVSSLVSWSTYTPFIWHIIDNPKLNFEPYCIARYGFNVDLNVYGNLKDCGCKIVRIGPKSLPYYPNCTRINGGMDNGLKITLVNESMDLSGLLRLKTLIGNIEVYETSLQNISFLENLSLIEFNYTFHWLDIHDNPKLTRLGLGSLKTLLSSYDSRIKEPNMRKRMRLVNNHPDFCITTNELQLLAKHNVEFCFGFEAKLCQNLYRKDGEKVCYFGNLSEMDADCQHIIGDVLVNSYNEGFVKKLENVTHIYGSLAVEGTKGLTDTSFLVNLQQVAAIKLEDDKPLIRFNDNKKLQRVFLQNMRARPWPYGYDGIIEIKGNDLEIFKNQRECLLFQKLTQTSIKYNRLSCGESKPWMSETRTMLHRFSEVTGRYKLPNANSTGNPTNSVTSNPADGQDEEEENGEGSHFGSTAEPEIVATTKLTNNFRNFKIILLCVLVINFPSE
ncbi:hypothetical protein CAEBREN_21687 [Caenorhabditis brenneri]|uniref:Receptor L-domain domain-containing protein n=1 Tax=Caenorhabditis brenneri TaxID=135651 RepID=G0M8S3_CAEBE|nr:hypothetical protein CAEBREN_21687 [Caenorhabditis brenneri]